MPDDNHLGNLIEVNDAPLGFQIDEIWALREKVREHEDKIKDLKAVITGREYELLLSMEKQGVASIKGKIASASISESVVPQVEDWTALYAFIRRNNAFELLERRCAAGAFREHAERRRDHTVPGVVPFTKRKVSIRTNT